MSSIERAQQQEVDPIEQLQRLGESLVSATEWTTKQTKQLDQIRRLRAKLPPQDRPELPAALEILFTF